MSSIEGTLHIADGLAFTVNDVLNALTVDGQDFHLWLVNGLLAESLGNDSHAIQEARDLGRIRITFEPSETQLSHQEEK